MKILIAPLHYVASPNDGSEYTRAYDYLQHMSKHKDLEGDVLVGYMEESVIGNFKIHSMLSSKPQYISIMLRIQFILWVYFKSIKILQKDKFDLIWHNGPFAINETFNLIILKTHRQIKSIIGPIVSPHTYLSSDEARSMGKKLNNSSLLLTFVKLIDTYLYKLSWIVRTMSRKTIQVASLVIAKDEQSKTILDMESVNKLKKITIGPNVDKFIHKPRKYPTKKLINIISVGYLTDRKFVIDTIYAIYDLVHKYKVNKIHLDIIGDGPTRKLLESTVDDLNIQKYVTFKGFIPKNLVHKIYYNADIFVSSSISESMPAMYLEAMAAAIPMVIAENSTSKELKESGIGAIIVPKNSSSQMAKALYKLILNKNIYEKYSRLNYELTNIKYSFHKQMENLIATMRETI